MKSRLFLCLFICGYGNNFAQQTTIEGTVVDSAKEPVAFAHIILKYIEDPQKTYGALTDETGYFSMKIPKQNYQLEISIVGLPPNISILDLRQAENTTPLGSFIINTEIALDAVVMNSKSSNDKIELDKKIYEVSKDLSLTGGSLIDLMQNIPSVQVEVDGSLRIRGKGSLRILIDGRISGLTDSASFLRTIPAASIAKIEVITNPSSKYSAEGTGGIINIVLKKGKKNRLGSSLELFTGMRLNSGFNINLNKTNDLYSWYFNTGLGYSEPKATGSIALTNSATFSSESFQTSEKIWKQFYSLNNVGAAYKFSKKHSVSADLTYRFADLKTDNKIVYEDYGMDDVFTTSERLDSEALKNNFIQIASEYKLKIDDKGSQFKLSLLSQSAREDGESNIIDKTTVTQEQITAKDIVDNDIIDRRFTIALDYVHKFKDKSQLEFGGRSRSTVISNDYAVKRFEDDTSITIPEFTDATNYDEHITAFYAQYAKGYKKFKFQVGLRTEKTRIDIHSNFDSKVVSRKYTDLFPSSFFTYQFNKDNSIRLSASRRIQRPRRDAIVPFSSFSDARHVFVGNPEVNPSYALVTELALESNISDVLSISPTLFYRRTHQDMDYFIQRENLSINGRLEEVFVTKTVNIGTDTSYGLELGFNYNPVSWLGIFNELTINGYSQNGSYKTTNFNSDGIALSGRLHFNFQVTETLKIQFQNRFRGANNRGQLSRRPLYRLDFGMSKALFNNMASLNVSFKDIFDSWEWHINSQGNNFTQKITSQVRVPQLNVSFMYRWNEKRYKGKKGQQYDRL